MKEIVVLGDRKLTNDLKHIMGKNFSVTQVQVTDLIGGNAPSAAVLRIRELSDLNKMEGKCVPFIVVADSAEEELLDRAVELGAKYFYVAPVPAETLALRLEWLAREECAARAVQSYDEP